MPSSAMVPSTHTRTRTMGATAITPSTGWRWVTQKKRTRMPRATAMVTLTASTCCPVMASVTVTDMIPIEVAVAAVSSPSQSSSMSSWSDLVALGLPE